MQQNTSITENIGMESTPSAGAPVLSPILPAMPGLTAPTQNVETIISRSQVLSLPETAQEEKITPSIEDLIAILVRETRAARRRKRHRRLALVFFGLVLLGLWRFEVDLTNPFWWAWMLLPSGLLAADRAVGARRTAAYRLSQAGDPRAVGVLALALRDGDSFVRRIAAETLQQLLPRLKANDVVYLTAEQRNALLMIAFQNHSPRLQIALLQALAQIGNAQALPVVEHLMRHEDPTVRAQAEACLPFLHLRVREATERTTLLRSGTAIPTADREKLLRPALESTGSASKDDLLRPFLTELEGEK